jgi:hypothetical protein
MTLIVSFVVITLSAFPQQTFFTQIEDDKYHKPWDILIKADGNMLFCSIYWSTDESWSSIFEVNNFGEIVNEWTFTINEEEYLQCTRMLEVDDNIFLFGEGQKTTSGSNEEYVSMHKFDLQLNEIENFRYKFTGVYHTRILPNRVIFNGTSIHVMGSIMDFSTLMIPFYLNIDIDGVKLQSAYYNSTPDRELGLEDFCFLHGSGNLFTICHDVQMTQNAFGHVIEFNPSMSIISQFQFGVTTNGFSIFSYKGISTNDSLIYLAYNFIDGVNNNFNSIVEKCDLNGNVLNEFVFESPSDSASWIAHLNAMDTLQDGNLILCTTKNLDANTAVQHEPTKIMLFKLSPNLDLIWQKYLFGDEGMYEAYSIKAHPDGGIVVLGTYSPTPPTSFDIKEVFLMKTDKEGLLTGIGENQQQIKTTEAILYPNPASEIINIEFSQVYQTATIQLLDIGGKMVLEKQLNSNYQNLNISALPAGTYVYGIFNKDGLDERGKLVVE